MIVTTKLDAQRDIIQIQVHVAPFLDVRNGFPEKHKRVEKSERDNEAERSDSAWRPNHHHYHLLAGEKVANDVQGFAVGTVGRRGRNPVEMLVTVVGGRMRRWQHEKYACLQLAF
jgi:hypothetical protein